MEIRSFTSNDEASVKRIYREAFAGYPWFENLSEQTITGRWQESMGKSGFNCLVAEIDSEVVGATWWDAPSLEDLALERGADLAEFAKNNLAMGMEIVWIRDTIVHPGFQKQGIASLLKEAFLLAIAEQRCLTLTRMRDDNSPIIHINQKAGFERTGIRMPCNIKPSVSHEYWYLVSNQMATKKPSHLRSDHVRSIS